MAGFSWFVILFVLMANPFIRCDHRRATKVINAPKAVRPTFVSLKIESVTPLGRYLDFQPA